MLARDLLTKFGGVAPIADPALFFERNPSRKGAFLDFTTAGGVSAGLVSNTALPTIAAPTNGQTLSAVVARRHRSPLVTGLGSELWTNPVPDIQDSNGTVGAYNSTSRVMSNSGATFDGYPRFSFNLGLSTGALYLASGTLTGAITKLQAATPIRLVTVGAANNLAYNTSTGAISGLQIAGGASVQFLTAISSVETLTISSFSLKEAPARIARQSLANSKPVWSSDNGGKVTFDGVDDVLAVALPSAFTGDLIALLADGSFYEASGVSFGTTYNFSLSCKCALMIENLTATERQQVKAYMRRLPLS